MLSDMVGPTPDRKTESRPKRAPPAPKKGKPKELQPTITDFFSERRRSTRVLFGKEPLPHIPPRLLSGCEDGLEVVTIEPKGLGIKAERYFDKGDFVCEYIGDLITQKAGHEREAEYAKDPTIGCYMYFFRHKQQSWCVDATRSHGCGRLINHGSKGSNLRPKVIEVDGVPRLCFFASADITPGEELLYDYGDKRKEARAAHPWLAE